MFGLNTVIGLPNTSVTKGVCEGCMLRKHHKEKNDKRKSMEKRVTITTSPS